MQQYGTIYVKWVICYLCFKTCSHLDVHLGHTNTLLDTIENELMREIKCLMKREMAILFIRKLEIVHSLAHKYHSKIRHADSCH